jgi:uncharacterized protein YndB with AHSA1/START domain
MRYDIIDETDLDAAPDEVWAALLDGLCGRADWWEPVVRMRATGDLPFGQVGSAVDATIRDSDTSRRRVHLSSRIRAVDPGRRLLLDHVHGGAFRGVEEWTLHPLADGRTHVRVWWRSDPHGPRMWLAALFQDAGARHSQVVRRGFAGLAAHVRSTPVGGAAR